MLDKILLLLGHGPNIEQVKLLIEMTTNKVMRYIRKHDPTAQLVPSELDYIIIELVVKRYNRIGSEGMQSESVEGHAVTYNDTDDFKDYINDIDDYMDSLKGDKVQRQKVRFL